MALSQTGPLTQDTKWLALGLFQVRVDQCTASNIIHTNGILSGQHSMGAMAKTRIALEKEYFTHEAGFPLLEDAQLPIRERALMEFAFEEINGRNMMLAAGKNPFGAGGSGEIVLGDLATPSYMRVEAWYTYPNKIDQMIVVFPRCQFISNTELDFQKEENNNSPVTVRATRADSGVSGGSAVWDNMPLGRIYWKTAS